MRYVVLVMIIAILFSLGSALFYLVRDRGTSNRTIRALAVRVGLSILLFVLLMAGHYFGFIEGRLLS